MINNFEDNWNFIVNRSKDACMPVVQDKEELRYVSNLLAGCTSYLEVGTAEGNSLYVLAKSMPPGSFVCFVDLGEKHTLNKREFILNLLNKDGYDPKGVLGDSTLKSTHDRVTSKLASLIDEGNYGTVDAILIDGGHDYTTVLSDAIMYGNLSTKYIIFHDIQLPEVNAAYEWYKSKNHPDKKSYRVVNSETYGYGIIEL